MLSGCSVKPLILYAVFSKSFHLVFLECLILQGKGWNTLFPQPRCGRAPDFLTHPLPSHHTAGMGGCLVCVQDPKGHCG